LIHEIDDVVVDDNDIDYGYDGLVDDDGDF
jgi:hypothetical protein